MHVFSDFFHHDNMVVIFITSIYMVLMMSPCALVCGVVMSIRIEWCGNEYKDRVVFLISDRFAYTYYMWIEVTLMSLIYTMLQEALLFNLQIMIQDMYILINAQDSTGRN